MKQFIILFCWCTLCYGMCMPLHAQNWLERKRQNTLEQRRASERIQLEKKRLEEERLSREQAKREAEKREEEERRAREQREEEMRKESERRNKESKEELARRQAIKEAADARVRNRREALRCFDICKGDVWVTTKTGLFAFADKDECLEYVEYGLTNAAYAKRYARDLLDDSVIQVSARGHLKISESNHEELIISEYELRHAEEEETLRPYKSPHAAIEHLLDCCHRNCVVCVRTFREEEYWVAYRDLKEFAKSETKRPNPSVQQSSTAKNKKKSTP